MDKERPEEFTVEQLRRWKEQREATPREALERLRAVTPSGLKAIVAEGIKTRDDRILTALARLSESDQEAVLLIRNLIDELTEVYSSRRPVLDPDVVEMFSRATRRLQLGPDEVASFSRATYRLRLTPTDISRLSDAVDRLQGALDSGILESFIRATRRLPEY
ncbi:hypothetical protein [Microbispora triticiradicis]|uniref:hypothetical protein n=1 Tax=Microbispora triticiradicis TaxID=2200763 RepID=UPI001AD7D4A8|nr:hypothetical protein [Microbispora triticiradicis]MBO4273150.1 hypothetical protein [Microbispora triticiradicis]